MQLIVNALIAGSLLALMAGGLALVYGILDVFNLALGQMALIGGYLCWRLLQLGVPLPLAILGGIGGGALLSWLTFLLVVKPFYRRHRFLPIVTTIGWGMVLDGVILLVFGEQPVTLLSGVKSSFLFLGARFGWHHVLLCSLTFVGLAVFAWVLHSTALGRRLRAVVQHPQAAMSLGIPASALHAWIFVVSGVLAAGGGLFIGFDQTLTPTLAFALTIKAYAAVIVGGRGNFWGAILAAYFIALLEQLVVGIQWPLVGYLSPGYQFSVALLSIIVFLLFKPTGLFATPSRTA